ncbi:MAG TPA: hypothetical protein H9684_02735 [Firmicutes bacterium]|nr:hypothetical protein [Bacillota bacterium]
MKEQEFIDAMNAVHLDKKAEDRIIRRCQKGRPPRLFPRRPVWTAAAAFAAALVLLAGIPFLRRSSDTGKTEVCWLDALTFRAGAKGFGTEELEKNIVTRIPSGICILFVEEERDGQTVEVVDGTVAPDFAIDGEGIRSVTYTAETGLLLSEFDSYFHDGAGNFLWSQSCVPVPLEEYGNCMRDWKNPTQAELVAILDAMHAKGEPEGELAHFYNMYYNKERAATDGKTGQAWFQAYEKFLEKCREPMDFNAFTVYADVDENNSEYPLFIQIENPAHPPLGTVQARSVTVSPGDTVSWVILEAISGKTREELDLAQIRDTIHVAVTYEDGTVRECGIALQFSDDGELFMELTGRPAPAG